MRRDRQGAGIYTQSMLHSVGGGYSLWPKKGRSCGGSCLRLRVITPQGGSLKIGNTRSLATHSLRMAQLLACSWQCLMTLSMSTTTGEVVFRLPFLRLNAAEGVKPQPTADFLYKLYVQPFSHLIELIIKESVHQGATACDDFAKVQSLENVSRYWQMMHISCHFND
jgi:hypothetical protein